jgi:NAD(P)-dependent dehydrogenase (short-subunit alcohol dehydrogenase family)
MLYGVDVVVIDPATVATPIWGKGEDLDRSMYANSPYLPAMKRMADSMIASGRRGSPPELIGRLVVRVLGARKPRARYMIGRGSARIWIITHLLRPRGVDRLLGRALGLKPTGLKPGS